MGLTQDRRSGFEVAVARGSRMFAAIGGLILVSILLIIVVGVVTRYAFNSPIAWADQVATYGLVYLTFIGAPQVLARRGHVAVDILQTSLSARSGRLLQVVLDVVGLLYCLAFSTLAIQELLRVMARGSTFADAFVLPQWVIYLAIPIGAIMLALQFLANLLSDLRVWRSYTSPG